jgi:hypothetical protein
MNFTITQDETTGTFTVSDGNTYTSHDTLLAALTELRTALILEGCPYCGKPTLHEDTNGWCRQI